MLFLNIFQTQLILSSHETRYELKLVLNLKSLCQPAINLMLKSA